MGQVGRYDFVNICLGGKGKEKLPCSALTPQILSRFKGEWSFVEKGYLDWGRGLIFSKTTCSFPGTSGHLSV